MIKQSPAQFYMAQQRSLAENKNHRLHATFNAVESSTPSIDPFGALTLLNDETLAAGKYVERTLTPGSIVMIIPIVGAAECSFNDNEQIVIPGEAFTHHSPDGGTLTIKNPYDESLINFLYVSFSVTVISDVLQSNDFLIAKANLAERNHFHKLYESFQTGLSVQMSIFDGRAEIIHSMANPTNGIFTFVINGAFEVQGRLMESHDGLALWETEEIEMEALSDNAIMLLIETPLIGFTAT